MGDIAEKLGWVVCVSYSDAAVVYNNWQMDGQRKPRSSGSLRMAQGGRDLAR